MRRFVGLWIRFGVRGMVSRDKNTSLYDGILWLECASFATLSQGNRSFVSQAGDSRRKGNE